MSVPPTPHFVLLLLIVSSAFILVSILWTRSVDMSNNKLKMDMFYRHVHVMDIIRIEDHKVEY
jgi:hypothetical protein